MALPLVTVGAPAASTGGSPRGDLPSRGFAFGRRLGSDVQVGVAASGLHRPGLAAQPPPRGRAADRTVSVVACPPSV